MHRIGFVIYPGFQVLDFAGPAAAFDLANEISGSALYSYASFGTRRSISAYGGLQVQATGWRDIVARELDTVIIAGGPGAADPVVAKVVAGNLASLASRGVRIASVCTGAILLGKAGLLDNRRCTTHWAYAEKLARIAPKAVIEIDRIFVEDDGIWTSAGMTAGIDMALAMIAEDHGRAPTKEISKALVVYFKRPGGQSQFSDLVEAQSDDLRIERAHAWVLEHLSERLTVNAMAEVAGMSERQFSRLYRRHTGITPAKGIERLRLERARALLAAPSSRIQQVAHECGFGTPETMRAAFQRQYGLPPQFIRQKLDL